MPVQTLDALQKEIEIKVSSDEMKAYLILNPNDDFGLNIDEIKQQLWMCGVNFGIKEKLIQKAIETKFFGKSFVVAEGHLPVNGQDAGIDYKFGKRKDVSLAEDINGRVNFRESANIETVKKAEVIAIKKPATPGTAGKTVTARVLKVRQTQDIKILAGKNTQLSEDGLELIATEDGYVFWQDGIINVRTTYEVDGDVDMSTGNIYFVGPVVIKGGVKEGFIVDTKGSIEVREGVENATLRAEGSITVVNGIIGKRTYVSAEGDIRCKFIENATVEAKGNVLVEDAILHSKVEADGNVIVLSGKKGAIIGGKISAGGEVNVKNIGSISEIATEIEAGINPAMRQELKDLEECLEADRKELHEVKLRYNTLMVQNRVDLAAEALDRQQELESRLRRMTDELNQVKKQITANQEGKVSVVERIWPGVRLTIGKTPLLLKVDDKYVTFIERLGSIERREYQRPKEKVEVNRGKVKYWEEATNPNGTYFPMK